jgi:hypothetical protein
MSVITDTWRQLVRRRLWPVALLLVAALAAVPFLLAKDPEPAGVAPATTVAAATPAERVLEAEPVVALARPEDRTERRRVLGARHDIFKPTAKAPKAPKAPRAVTVDSPAEAPAGDDGGSAPSEVPATSTPEAPEQPKEEKAAPPPAGSVTVRFGRATGAELTERTLEKLSPLGGQANPVAVYVGPAARGEGALFMLSAGVVPTGDGICKPDPDNCETLALKAGETEFLDVLAEDGTTAKAQFQLDVVKVHRRGKGEADDEGEQPEPTRQIKAFAAGRSWRASRAVRRAAWRYDGATGTLKRR